MTEDQKATAFLAATLARVLEKPERGIKIAARAREVPGLCPSAVLTADFVLEAVILMVREGA